MEEMRGERRNEKERAIEKIRKKDGQYKFHYLV